MRIHPGLCSVTFRAMTTDEVIAVARANGVCAIEWGGDVHVPVGGLDRARDVGIACKLAGIVPASYGSYVRAGDHGALAAFDAAVATTAALGAGNIRVWAGRANLETAGARAMDLAAADLTHMAQAAAGLGITVSVEYHCNTLTEKAEDALVLLQASQSENLFTYWQPVPGRGLGRWLSELETLAPFLGDVHVFHWTTTGAGLERRPLAEGADEWRTLFSAWTATPRWPHPARAYLEFVRDDDSGQFLCDMAQLRALCGAAESN